MNDEKRFEAEFFRKRFLTEDVSLSRFQRLCLGSFATVTDGPHGYHVVDDASPVAMLTAKCASDWFADRSKAVCIARHIDEENIRSRLRNRDVVLSTRGTVGMCALVVPEALPANIDQDLARVSWDDESAFLPEFVLTYLNSRFGQDYIERYSSGMVQQGMSLSRIRDIPIPKLSKRVQRAITDCVQNALRVRQHSEKSLQSANDILMRALGLGNWQPPEPLTYTSRASEAFAAGRLDAQYFTPRVAELIACLGKGRQAMSDVATPRRKRFSAVGSGDFHYIEISDVRNDGTVACESLPISDAPSRATWYVCAGDVLTSTVRPVRRLSALVMPDQDGCVASSGFVVLQPQSVPAEVLLTYLRLPLFCELMDLHTSASMYPAISDKDLLALPFPKIPKKAQDGIVAAVQSAHASRQHAHVLLDAAKRAVEIAIEDSEAKAMAYLKSQGA
ncbi:MAG: hypothetical protein ABFC77_02185 [Thermoguttaceae bacterium]